MKTNEYYLMRHASYYDHKNDYVSYQGMLSLKESMSLFLNDFNINFSGKKLRIIHSILPRAKHTVLLMEEMLFDIKTLKSDDPELNSNCLKINKNYINRIVSDCDKENEICLFLSHQSDIEDFIGKNLRNSEWVKMSTEFEGKPTPVSGNDDLPF